MCVQGLTKTTPVVSEDPTYVYNGGVRVWGCGDRPPSERPAWIEGHRSERGRVGTGVSCFSCTREVKARTSTTGRATPTDPALG